MKTSSALLILIGALMIVSLPQAAEATPQLFVLPSLGAKRVNRAPQSVEKSVKTKALKTLTSPHFFKSSESFKSVVVALTQDGFVPDKITLKQDKKYRVHFVNLHPIEKNVSLIVEAFSHYLGAPHHQLTSFDLKPQVEGVFSIESPETGSTGEIVVIQSRHPKKE